MKLKVNIYKIISYNYSNKILYLNSHFFLYLGSINSFIVSASFSSLSLMCYLIPSLKLPNVF